ncbi:MAG TPA: nickel pincer cofactor biosynthesis protein LarB [Mycobacteriales bacterium]|nr:nickel pincer cofactor biosynthesis protein LarB [Mycobacteriales bacterium]
MDPDPHVADLGFARVDLDRAARTGDPETVYAEGKTPEQTVAIVGTLRAHAPERVVLVTRTSPAHDRALVDAYGADAELHPTARCVTVGPLPEPHGQVLVVAAGTSDGAVAAEAAVSAAVHGAGVERIDDVGVAGLHRLLAVRDRLAGADCLIVIAGMEGALPSVVAGLVGVPLVAVPTSIGYGVGQGGLTALAAMLSSCAPGVVVVNIDNGYGAGVHAARVARAAAPRTDAERRAAASRPQDGHVVVEANVDDLDPRLWPGVLDALLAAGAVDAWLTPITMKKGRPAHTVSALTTAAHVDAVGDALLAQTSTIGYRVSSVGKVALERREVKVEVRGHPIRVKVAERDGLITPNAMPEWDDVHAAALALDIPAKRVLAEAQAAALALWDA